MKLHPPFIISSHLAPALRIADATLSLIGEDYEGDEIWGSTRVKGRTRCTFVIETPEFTYTDESMRTGAAGTHSTVQLFETFLSFMEACGESLSFTERTGRTGDHNDMFPEHVGQWIRDNLTEVQCARCDLCDPEDGCTTLNHLIEED
jgi:hypothetical protein